jgi:TRAP-type C4-dicarboxylate transport system permease small subunit
MKAAYRKAMDALYLVCMGIAGIALVIMSVVIPWGVFARYVLSAPENWPDFLEAPLQFLRDWLGHDSSWPEPMSIQLIILFTFFAGAACYRAGVHISVGLFADALKQPYRKAVHLVADLLLAAISVAMVIWGLELADTTWEQWIAEFPWLRVGITYLFIPVGGALLLLFIVERLWLGPPPADSIVHREPVEAN